MKKWKIGLAVLALLLVAGGALYFIPRAQSGFTGRRVRNPDEYLLEIERMNGTDQHALSLQKGDVLHVELETAAGSLRLKVTCPDGTALYEGNGAQVSTFTLTAPETGEYLIAVEGKNAQGMLHIRLAEKE